VTIILRTTTAHENGGYCGLLRDAFTTIDSTKKKWPDGYGNPLELIFGKKFQLPIFETSLSTMLVDEVGAGSLRGYGGLH